jgi:hypothetical protein
MRAARRSTLVSWKVYFLGKRKKPEGSEKRISQKIFRFIISLADKIQRKNLQFLHKITEMVPTQSNMKTKTQ